MTLAPLAPALLAGLLASPTAQAGSRWIQNDGFVDGATAGFQGGFIKNECWGSIYVPEPDEYPFTLEKVRMLVGGSTSIELFTIHFYSFPGTTWDAGASIGGEGVVITGSNEAFNDITIEELKLELDPITSGNVGVSVCFEEHSGYPAIARDTDGNISGNLNWIYASGSWWRSNVFGLAGDWIMRLCIAGDDVEDEPCIEDTGGDGDGGSTDGGAGDGGAGDGGAGDGGGDGGVDSGDGGGDGGLDSGDGGYGDLLLFTITPAEADEGEAVNVVLLGEGFGPDAEARIGGLDLTGQDIVNPETIQGRSPSSLPPGLHDVEVEFDGQSAVLPAAFEVVGEQLDGDDGKSGGCGCAGGPASGGLLLAFAGLLGLRRRRR